MIIKEITKNMEYPIELFDKNRNLIYYEHSNSFWSKREYDKNNNLIYCKDSSNYWYKRKFDKNNNLIYHKDSSNFWSKREFDENNNIIYYEDSNGFWYKCEYDNNNNVIYREDSINGIILDKRDETIEELIMKELKLLVYNRFTKKTLLNKIRTILDNKHLTLLEEERDADDYSDWSFICSTKKDDKYIDITIFYAKTRIKDLIITEIQMEIS
jgi:hypothetical protein